MCGLLGYLHGIAVLISNAFDKVLKKLWIMFMANNDQPLPSARLCTISGLEETLYKPYWLEYFVQDLKAQSI